MENIKILEKEQSELLTKIAVQKSNIDTAKSKLTNLQMELLDVQAQILKAKSRRENSIKLVIESFQDTKTSASLLYDAFKEMEMLEVAINIENDNVSVTIPESYTEQAISEVQRIINHTLKGNDNGK